MNKSAIKPKDGTVNKRDTKPNKGAIKHKVDIEYNDGAVTKIDNKARIKHNDDKVDKQKSIAKPLDILHATLQYLNLISRLKMTELLREVLSIK